MGDKTWMDGVMSILEQCHATDARFPAPSRRQAEAWAAVFKQRGYTINQLKMGVLEFYASDTYGRQAMPGLIMDAAEQALKKQADMESPEARAYRLAVRRWRQDCAIAEAEGDLYPPQPKREDFTNATVV